jgi:hypothetical protein
MASRFLIVLYGLCVAWLALNFAVAGGVWSQFEMQMAAIFGLPPLIILGLVRWLAVGRLP